MVLACSRHMFVRTTLVMDQRAFTDAHVAAFRLFGGVPRRLVTTTCAPGWTSLTCMTRS
jgi:transposase